MSSPESRFGKCVLIPVEKPEAKRSKKPGVATSTLLAGLITLTTCVGPERNNFEMPPVPNQEVIAMQELPAIYRLDPKSIDKFHNPEAVRKAVGFIRMLQPEGTYILTSQGENDIVHMDVAHSAIALSKVEGYLDYAEGAMDWLLERATKPGDPDAEVTRITDGKPEKISYVGSLHDHYDIKGNPKESPTRARGEGMGMILIAIHSIYQQKPDYLDKEINGQKVIDYVDQISQYLISLQNGNGTFSHRPDNKESFDEEVARMALGLKLSGEMLESKGFIRKAEIVKQVSKEGLNALREENGFKKGMAFDHYANTIWSLADKEVYKNELAETRRVGMVTDDGVLNWDRQADTNIYLDNLDKTLNGFKYWGQSFLSYGPAQDIDWGISSAIAGDIHEALKVEKRQAESQYENGGIPAVTIRYINRGIGPPTSYTAARLVLFESLLAEAIPRG